MPNLQPNTHTRTNLTTAACDTNIKGPEPALHLEADGVSHLAGVGSGAEGPEPALQPYLLERQQAHDKGVGLDRVAHRTPVDKGALGLANDAENLEPCEPSPHIVVGLAAASTRRWNNA